MALIGRATDQRNRRQEIGTVVQWRCAMIAVACAFGPPKQCQAEAIGSGMVRHWRQRADVGEIMADCRGVPTSGMALEEVLGRLGNLPQSLRPSDKEHFLQSAREVVRAGEGGEKQQRDLLDAIAARLGISEDGMRRALAA
ncbi:hypothetical protein GCM10007874_05240 [Labrys miyagiensis]|uniref:Tellurite resistance protein TerB n=1 Tax=Labrys miyagiensis TaxID=346912 RepID=A0ABQ6CCH1_9HYPH|nr:hypothetical protein [Labrys miyagiensis]GLS17509.1 hypothetical protein GCM10007874_05240 [Labrys miyagiensis]